jgi:hypothetical protein
MKLTKANLSSPFDKKKKKAEARDTDETKRE